MKNYKNKITEIYKNHGTTNSLHNNAISKITFPEKIKTTQNASNYRKKHLPRSRKLNNKAYQTYMTKYTPDIMKELQKMSTTTKLQRMRNVFRSSQNRAKKEKERQTAGEIFRAISTSRQLNNKYKIAKRLIL